MLSIVLFEKKKLPVNYTDDINGTWKFEFKTNGDRLKIDTKTINLNEEFER